MNGIIDEFTQIQKELESVVSSAEQDEFKSPTGSLLGEVKKFKKSWSGSFLGYHSRVYYLNFDVPPPGAHFSPEWGLMGDIFDGTTGKWMEYDFDDVRTAIHSRAGNPDLENIRKLSKNARRLFETRKTDLVSLLAAFLENYKDNFLETLKSEIKKNRIITSSNYLQSLLPNSFSSRDSTAIYQGVVTPPHIYVECEVLDIMFPFQACEKLAELTRQVCSHISRKDKYFGRNSKMSSKKVFIGHGHSSAWRDLKDFLQDRLRLDWEEYNREPTAGMATKERLEQMLECASFAFLVMTAEDEHADKSLHARENVIHEIGLFQGKLGFMKAIILLEEGCREFSNIIGLSQIRFPKGNIMAASEDIRRVLEREGALDSK